MDKSKTAVLVVDRDDADRRVFEHELSDPNFSFSFTDDRDRAAVRLASGEIGVLVIDLSDIAIDGSGLLSEIRADAANDDVPIIVLLDRSEVDRAGSYMDAGADFFALKPLEPELARSRLVAAARRSQLQAEIRRQLQHFKILNEVGIALSAERNINRLLERILLHAKDITSADGGTIYMATEDDRQ